MDNIQKWKSILSETAIISANKAYNKYMAERRAGYNAFPPPEKILNALKLTGPDQVKAVILGQDPYHETGQADGLAFSVGKGTLMPPSLRNIFREMEDDLGIRRTNTDLSDWAEQGVLLLNTTLTVREGLANSHKDFGWRIFTDDIIRACSKTGRPMVFILWGRDALDTAMRSIEDPKKAMIISSTHPSPLSAARSVPGRFDSFFGSRPFSRTNKYLKENNIPEIVWG